MDAKDLQINTKENWTVTERKAQGLYHFTYSEGQENALRSYRHTPCSCVFLGDLILAIIRDKEWGERDP